MGYFTCRLFGILRQEDAKVQDSRFDPRFKIQKRAAYGSDYNDVMNDGADDEVEEISAEKWEQSSWSNRGAASGRRHWTSTAREERVVMIVLGFT